MNLPRIDVTENGIRYAMGAVLLAAWPALLYMEHELPDIATHIDQVVDFVKYGLVTVTGWHLAAWSPTDPKDSQPNAPAVPEQPTT